MRKSTVATLFVIALVTTAGAGTPAVAATEEPFIDKLLGVEDDDGVSIASILAGAQGAVDRYKLIVSSAPSPEADLDAIAAWHNTHSEALARYANARIDNPEAHNVIEIVVWYNGESETKYLVSPVKNGNYTPGKMVESPTHPGVANYVELDDGRYIVQYENGSTGVIDQLHYEVDDTVVISGKAVGVIGDDIRLVFDRHVQNNTDVDRSLATRLAAKYSGSINTTLTGAA